MENVFLHLLNMSLTAGLLVVVVMVLRLAFHKAPRWIHCLLWALVAVRLLCPISFESHLSLMPDTEAAISAVQDAVTETPAPDQSVVTPPDTNHSVIDPPTTNDPVVVPPATNDPVVVPPATDTPVVTPLPNQPITPESSVSAATPEASVDPWQVAVSIATYVWLAGVALLAVYAVITTLRLHRQVREAARLTDRVWCCDHLRSPFILGVLRPRIYIPSDLNPTARASVLAHEQAHLHRRDHWWKPLGFILLTVYWFNPLMWVAYILLCRDIESACDERVVRDMTAADRKAYSEALLACSAPRRLVSACPLAFGETSVKSRIKSVLSYKKPTIWIIVAALLISTVAGVCLLTDRPVKVSDALDECIVSTIRDAYATEYVDVRYPAVAYTVFDIEKDGDTTTVYGMMMYREYTCTTQGELQGWMMEQSPFILTAKAVGDGYETVDCWWQDKANRETSIREKLPSRYVKKALNFKDFWDTHGPACEADAKANIADGDKYVFLQPEEADVNVFIAYQQDGKGCFIRSSQENRNRSYIGRYAHHSNGHVIFDLGEIKAAFRIRDGKFIYNEYLSSGIPSDVLPPSNVFCLADNTVFCAVSSLTNEDDTPDDPDPDATAPVGLTYADRSDIGSGEEAEEIFGSSSVKRFDSRAEFETFLTTYQKTERNHNRWEISDFDQFDETFFTENVLLMTRYTLGSGSITPYVAEYTYSEDRTILSVGVDELHPSFGTDDMAFWLLFSGIKKVDLQGVTELKSHLRKEIPTDRYVAGFSEPTEHPDKATEKWREFYGYWDEVYLRAMITRLNDGAWVENSSAINRALNFVGCVHINGNLYYVTDQFDGIMSTDGKVGWLTTEESVRVSWLFDEKEHPAYTFIGKVKKVDGNNVLMECLESEWLTGDVWVDFSRFVKSRVGETLKITYDYMELTDPPRVTPIEVAYVSVNPTTGTTNSTTTTTTKPTTGTSATTKPTTTPTTPTTPSQPETAPVGLTYITRAGTSSNEEYEALYGTPIRRFDTRAELESFLIEFQTMGHGWKRWEISDFDQFDTAFFAQNSLLVTGWRTSSGMHTPQVAVYTYSEDGTALSVGVDELHPGFVTDDVGEWLLFSGIKKVDLQGVTELKAYLRKEIPTDSYMALLSKRTSDPQTVSEKWRKWIPGDEGWALSYIFAEIEKSDRWKAASGSSPLLEIVFNINGKTYYADRGFYELYSEDGSRRIALTADEYGVLQWIFASLSEDNEDIWVARFSHPVQNYTSNYVSHQIINTAAMRAILERESWIKNSNYSRSYDAFITWRGVYYYVDWANGQIVSNGKVITLTEAEQKYLTPIICDTYWGTKAYVTGYVYESGAGYFVLKVDTQYVKALGDKVKVSLLRWTDVVPAVGSRVGVSYDGYAYSYIYPCAIGEYLPEPAHDLEFWIGEFVGDVDFSNYQEKYGLFGGTEYYGTGYAPANNDPAMQVDPEHCVTYIVSSYPDEIDYGAHITSIRITDPNVKVYGISLKSSFDEFERALTQQGFTVEKQGSVARKATKGRFTITFTAEYIYISVATTNRYGIVY